MGMQSGHVYNGLNYFGANDTDWNLMGTGPSNRVYEKDVTFPTEFAEVPIVRVGLTGFYFLSPEQHPRLNIYVLSKATTGFTFRINVWGDCQLAGCGVWWMAYDSDIWM